MAGSMGEASEWVSKYNEVFAKSFTDEELEQAMDDMVKAFVALELIFND